MTAGGQGDIMSMKRKETETMDERENQKPRETIVFDVMIDEATFQAMQSGTIHAVKYWQAEERLHMQKYVLLFTGAYHILCIN